LIILNASNADQVASASTLEVLLGEPSRRMMIFSGIARPEIRVNNDEETYSNEVIVKLGPVVSHLESAVAEVGLASIGNDETAFTFTLSTARVEVEPATGQLQLRVMTELRGEDTWLHRFSYQIVAHVVKAAARISGTIRLPHEILDARQFPAAEVASWFRVTANRVDSLPAGGFSFEQLVPLAAARFGDVRHDDLDSYVDYTIDGCPFALPLRVTCDPGPTLQRAGATFVQVSGPRPVFLSNVEPEANGVDFAAARAVIR
jgi:hypothetical protein